MSEFVKHLTIHLGDSVSHDARKRMREAVGIRQEEEETVSDTLSPPLYGEVSNERSVTRGFLAPLPRSASMNESISVSVEEERGDPDWKKAVKSYADELEKMAARKGGDGAKELLLTVAQLNFLLGAMVKGPPSCVLPVIGVDAFANGREKNGLLLRVAALKYVPSTRRFQITKVSISGPSAVNQSRLTLLSALPACFLLTGSYEQTGVFSTFKWEKQENGSAMIYQRDANGKPHLPNRAVRLFCGEMALRELEQRGKTDVSVDPLTGCVYASVLLCRVEHTEERGGRIVKVDFGSAHGKPFTVQQAGQRKGYDQHELVVSSFYGLTGGKLSKSGIVSSRGYLHFITVGDLETLFGKEEIHAQIMKTSEKILQREKNNFGPVDDLFS